MKKKQFFIAETEQNEEEKIILHKIPKKARPGIDDQKRLEKRFDFWANFFLPKFSFNLIVLAN